MFYVYVLKSQKDESLYLGYTSDLRERVKRHNQGGKKFTTSKAPWNLVYYEAYRSKKDAVEREKQLKRFAKSYAMLKKRISNSMLDA